MSAEIKSTVLHDWHVSNGANMAAFGMYDMPLWYPHGAKSEHLAVIQSAGLFDTSHMAVVLVEGDEAGQLLQHCFSKDLDTCIGAQKRPLSPGRSVYGLFLTPEAHVRDDAIVSMVTTDCYMVVVNAGMGAPIRRHLLDQAVSLSVRVTDLTDRVGKIDIQGRNAARILARVLKDPDSVFDSMPYFSFKGWYDDSHHGESAVYLSDDTPVMLSRTGYTGEFGFELFVAPEKALSVWEMMLALGKDYALQPCGLAARDSLRAGAVLPLSHQDIGDWPFANNPWPFAIADRGHDNTFSKDFLGSQALLALDYDEYTLPFAGYDPRKMVVSENSYVTDQAGERIGIILTCATDMALGRLDDQIYSIGSGNDTPDGFTPRGLSCGFVKVNREMKAGSIVLLTDGKRKIKVEIRSDVRPDRTARRPLREML